MPRPDPYDGRTPGVGGGIIRATLAALAFTMFVILLAGVIANVMF